MVTEAGLRTVGFILADAATEYTRRNRFGPNPCGFLRTVERSTVVQKATAHSTLHPAARPRPALAGGAVKIAQSGCEAATARHISPVQLGWGERHSGGGRMTVSGQPQDDSRDATTACPVLPGLQARAYERASQYYRDSIF